ncbi:MAG TPA: hypothetical protein VII98_14305 [Solirubrobacteraceae bacterium]
MRIRTRSAAALAAGAMAVAGITTGVVSAWPGDPTDFASVPAQPKTPGITLGNVLSPGLTEYTVAQGSTKLENGAPCVQYYGYDVHVPGSSDCSAQAPFVPLQPTGQEANKTEPDKNTYLRLYGQTGGDPNYDYGSHFLFQGHETGSPGYITRINLDADAAHRVTLLATTEQNGTTPLPNIDGSTWDPWAKRLLFTSESLTTGGVWQATTDVPSTVVNLQGILGVGGYEGIQNDSAGNLWIVEDVGGQNGAQNPNAKQPNSFIYRFKPVDPTDLTQGGKLQALQVQSLRSPGQPIAFNGPSTGKPTGAQADVDITSGDTQDLHTYGHTFTTKWVTLHDTAVDGTTPFNANAAAKTAKATPFKRPENGQFQPGTGFRTFLFDETGDTDNRSQAIPDLGGFGGIQRLDQASPSADTGTLRLFYKGDQAHAGLDNVTFLSRNKVTFVEDAGDTLHTQRNALDSAYVFDTRVDYSATGAPDPVRFIAEGRDPSATLDSAGGPLVAGNEGDNEITGIHASDGDASRWGILGAKVPSLFHDGWRLFWTQQHGDNPTWEVVRGDTSRHGWDN